MFFFHPLALLAASVGLARAFNVDFTGSTCTQLRYSLSIISGEYTLGDQFRIYDSQSQLVTYINLVDHFSPTLLTGSFVANVDFPAAGTYTLTAGIYTYSGDPINYSSANDPDVAQASPYLTCPATATPVVPGTTAPSTVITTSTPATSSVRPTLVTSSAHPASVSTTSSSSSSSTGTTTTPAAAHSPTGTGKPVSAAAIGGGVGGGVAVLALIALLVACCLRRRKQQQANNASIGPVNDLGYVNEAYPVGIDEEASTTKGWTLKDEEPTRG